MAALSIDRFFLIQLYTLTLLYHRLQPFIIWYLSGDMLDDGSTPLLDAANAKLANPSIDCADMGNGVSASYLIAEAGGEAAGEVAEDKPKFYPHFDSSTCLSDGLQPSWLGFHMGAMGRGPI